MDKTRLKQKGAELYEGDVPAVYDFDAADMTDYSAEGVELRYVEGPDIDRWEHVLDSIEFREDIYRLDSILESHDYSVEMHVGESSFKQVEFDNRPRPDPLVLAIDDSYDEFTSNVHHPFFMSMAEGELMSPEGSDVAVKFGGYSDTEVIPANLRSIDVRVPTFQAYTDVLMEDAFSFDEDVF